MIKLDQQPGAYLLRFASYPGGDMQQVIEGQAIVSYNAESLDTGVEVLDDSASTWMLKNGSAVANVTELDPTLLRPFEGNNPRSGPADLTKTFLVSQTGIVTWVVDRYPYSEPTIPVLSVWSTVRPIRIDSGSTPGVMDPTHGNQAKVQTTSVQPVTPG
ncbi:hypothetical protein B0A49_13779, partial [Cryomyces minteri]